MGQRRNAESVRNFVIFLLILQNCGLARTQPKIEPGLQQRRDGLAKFEFSGSNGSSTSSSVATAEPLHVFNFATIYETLYAQLLQAPTGQQQGRGLRPPQSQLLWDAQAAGQMPVVLVTTPKPLNLLGKPQQNWLEQLKHSTTVKPLSVLQHLAQLHAEQLRQSKSNVSFNILQTLEVQQNNTVKPAQVVQQVEQEVIFEEIKQVEPVEQHKSVPAEATRAKDSQKRKRKRIRRRRKRIRRRRKRKRRRGKKKRKKKRKKRKKKKGDKDKDKKKKKRKDKRKKNKKPTAPPLLGQQAHLIFANPTKPPYYPHHNHYIQTTQPPQTTTTKRPTTTVAPFTKIKYLLRHNTLFKKKKKEYLNHVGHVLYPVIKFVAFFTVLNPFTLGVFLFTLVSPAVFGFLGFVALSVLVKPFLHLVFGVKRNVDDINRKRYLANKRAEQLKLNLRPVTIHKHFYQQKPLHSQPPRHLPPRVNWKRNTDQPTRRIHNPLLPTERVRLAGRDLGLVYF